jgi:hypothetical protein
MNNLEHTKRIHNILSKVQNGDVKYNTSPLFRSMVEVVVNGGSEWEMIDKLITMIEEQNQQFIDYVNRDTRPLKPSIH